MILTPRSLPLAIILLWTTLGCDDRAARVAQQAAERQAKQNLEMARVNQGALKAAEQLHTERAQLNRGRDALESERREIARTRQTESALSVLVSGGGAAVVVIFALALAWAVLADRSHDATEVTCELILREFAPQGAPWLPRCAASIDLAPLAAPASDYPSLPQESS